MGDAALSQYEVIIGLFHCCVAKMQVIAIIDEYDHGMMNIIIGLHLNCGTVVW
jgi:hypothetical protein